MVEFQFILTYNNQSITVDNEDQPEGLVGLISSITRDLESHGTFFKFTSNNLKLGFTGTAREWLNAAWEREGIDALVTISIQRRYNSFASWTEIYSGQAIMKSREFSYDYFRVDFQEVNILTKIMSRKDVVFDSNKSTNIDGGSMTGWDNDLMTFLGKAIRYESSISLGSQSIGGISTSGIPEWSFVNAASTNTIVLDELEFTNGIKQGAFLRDLTNEDSISDAKSFESGIEMQPEPTIGDYTISIRLNGGWSMPSSASTGDFPILSLFIYYYDIDEDGVQTFVGNSTSYDSINSADTTTQTFDVTKTFTVSSKIRRFIPVMQIFPSGGDFTASFTMNADFDMTVTWDSVYSNTLTNGYVPHKLIDKTLEYITGETDLLYSQVFGDTNLGYPLNSCLTYLLISNGYQIRKNTTRSIKTSLNNILKNLQSIYPIGWGLQLNEYDKTSYSFRVERFDYFYEDVELYSFSDIENESYNEEYYEFFEFSNIKVGYSKYASDINNSSSLDDFCTTHEYALPFKYMLNPNDVSEGNTYNLISDLIASDYLAETTRRKQFTQQPTKSWKYDDDLFIFYATLEVPFTNASGVYFGVAMTQDSNVENISGITNSDTAFNYELNPRYNLLNHAEIINSSLYKKNLTEYIYNTSVANNEDLTFNYKSTFNPCVGDLQRRSKAMNDNIQIAENDYGERKFDPIKISFRSAMSANEVTNIVLAHNNGLNADNYGYISVVNPDGDTVSGWLLRLDYNPIDEIGTFELIKKADDYFV